MSKHRVIVLKIVAGQSTVTEAAAEYGISRRQLHRLLARYREGGLDAVDPRSRRPKSNPAATPDEIREQIITLRRELIASGHDAGPVTIAWHLARRGHHPPSTSTIRRILHAAGLIAPEPRKRPKSSFVRFEAAHPPPHRARDRSVPAAAYRTTPKARPAGGRDGHYRLRYDRVDKTGRITLRRAGRMHHLAIGADHRGKRVLALIDETTVTVTHLDTGEIIATNLIDPDRGHGRNQQREPGRWPDSRL